MSELRELYQEMILDHGKRPRNFREQESARCADGHNPLCGDRVKVFVKIEDGRIEDVSFQGNGCAISTASASMMTEALRGITVEEADALFQRFHSLLASHGEETALGKLAVFKGVREFPMRVKCATLAWHTLRAAIDQANEDEAVSTE
jgi:nitrogen fixation NifU-like protein